MTSPRRSAERHPHLQAGTRREERGSSGEERGNLMFGGNQQRFRH